MAFLRKIGERLWNIKERLVLAAMVIILCYRVYIVANPQPFDSANIPRQPNKTADGVGPEPPPPPPDALIVQDWRPLWRNSLMKWDTRGGGPGDSEDEASANLSLERIMILPNGRKRAQIRSRGGSARWYDEGDSFESFRLQSIDADTECCVLFSEADNRPIEICKE